MERTENRRCACVGCRGRIRPHSDGHLWSRTYVSVSFHRPTRFHGRISWVSPEATGVYPVIETLTDMGRYGELFPSPPRSSYSFGGVDPLTEGVDKSHYGLCRRSRYRRGEPSGTGIWVDVVSVVETCTPLCGTLQFGVVCLSSHPSSRPWWHVTLVSAVVGTIGRSRPELTPGTSTVVGEYLGRTVSTSQRVPTPRSYVVTVLG